MTDTKTPGAQPAPAEPAAVDTAGDPAEEQDSAEAEQTDADEIDDEDFDEEDDEEEDEEEDDEEDEDDDDEEDEEDGDGEREGRGAALLIREGDLAADYLEGLLDVLDYDGDIDMDVHNGRAMVSISGSLHQLVGTNGATLESLQELTRLAVYRSTGSPSRLMLDIGGYRENRRKELAAVAKNAAEKVREYGEPVRLDPMSAFERKCVHDVINALGDVVSESDGVEPHRRVVVRPDGT